MNTWTERIEGNELEGNGSTKKTQGELKGKEKERIG